MGGKVRKTKSSIISLSILHSHEHRVQISSTLKYHGRDLLDLVSVLGIWSYYSPADEPNSIVGM